MLVEGLVQCKAVDQVAAHIQAKGLAHHLHRDILPLGVGQAHVLQGQDVLGAIQPVGEVQCVGRPIGDDLELPVLSAGALEGQQRAAGLAVLLQRGREEEALLLPHEVGDLAQVRRAYRRDVVKPHEAVGRPAGVGPPELLGPNGLPVDVADAEKVKGRVLVLVASCVGEQNRGYRRQERGASRDVLTLRGRATDMGSRAGK